MPSFEALQQHLVERPWRAGLYAFGALTLATLVLLAADTLLRPESFPVRNMSFEGEFQQVDQQALAAAVVDTVRGNFFLLNLDAIRARARSVPWVHEVTVRRRWPDGVHIQFSEQQLVARWGKSGWVNARGDYVNLHGKEGPANLPLLAGPDGLQARVLEHYRKLNEILAPVLRALIAQGYVAQRADAADRRRRPLFLTPKGAALEYDLTRRQSRRIARAFASNPALIFLCPVIKIF